MRSASTSMLNKYVHVTCRNKANAVLNLTNERIPLLALKRQTSEDITLANVNSATENFPFRFLPTIER